MSDRNQNPAFAAMADGLPMVKVSRAEEMLFGDFARPVRALGAAVEQAQVAAKYLAVFCEENARLMGAGGAEEEPEGYLVEAFQMVSGPADALVDAHRQLAEFAIRVTQEHEKGAREQGVIREAGPERFGVGPVEAGEEFPVPFPRLTEPALASALGEMDRGAANLVVAPDLEMIAWRIVASQDPSTQAPQGVCYGVPLEVDHYLEPGVWMLVT